MEWIRAAGNSSLGIVKNSWWITGEFVWTAIEILSQQIIIIIIIINGIVSWRIMKIDGKWAYCTDSQRVTKKHEYDEYDDSGSQKRRVEWTFLAGGKQKHRWLTHHIKFLSLSPTTKTPICCRFYVFVVVIKMILTVWCCSVICIYAVSLSLSHTLLIWNLSRQIVRSDELLRMEEGSSEVRSIWEGERRGEMDKWRFSTLC